MALLAAVLLFLALALPQLELPGLHYDEAKEAGVNAMEMLLRQDVQAFRSSGIQLGTVFVPLMVQDYIGALNVLLALPLLALFGITVPALRFLGVLCGLATLVLVWALGREAGSWGREVKSREPWAGEVAALLLAVSPTFVFWSRQGIFVTNIVVTLAVATVWTGLRWWRSGRPSTLYVLAVLAGLGLWAKLLFVWVLGAMLAVALAAWLAGWRPAANNAPQGPAARRYGQFAVALGLFVLALSPLLLFNQQTGGTFQSVFGNLGQSYYGVQNAAFSDNLAVRLGQVATLLRGDHLWYLGGPFANSVAPWIAAGIVVLGIAMALATRQRAAAVRLLLAGLFVGLLVVQSSFTVSGLFITHYAIVQPFVVLLVALAADGMWQVMETRTQGTGNGEPNPQVSKFGIPVNTDGGHRGAVTCRAVSLIVVVLLGLWFAAELQSSVRYHQALAQTGGYASHSDAVVRLADWLDARQVKQPVALDWGIDAPVRYLTENRVEPLEIFGYDRLDAPDSGFESRAMQFLVDPTRFYLVRMPDNTVFKGRKEALDTLAASQGLTVVIEEAFYDRSGKTMFVVLRAVLNTD